MRVGFHQNQPQLLRNPMTDYSELRKALQEHFSWHGARLSFLALFLLALIKVKTVNLSELALGFGDGH